MKLNCILLVFIFISVSSYPPAKALAQAGGQIEAVQNPDKIRSDTAIANNYFKMADSLLKHAQYDSSISYFKKASIIWERRAREADSSFYSTNQKTTTSQNNKGVRYWEEYVKCHLHICQNYMLKAEYNIALEELNRVLAVGLQKLGNKNTVVAGCYNQYGEIYRYKGEYDKALENYQKALNIAVKLHGSKHPYSAISYNNIGLIYDAQGDYYTALEYYQQAFNIFLKTLGPDHLYLSYSYGNIGSSYYDLGDYKKALECFQKALSIKFKMLSEHHPSIALSYNNLGNVYAEKDDFFKAMEYYQKSLSIKLKTLGPNHPSLVYNYINIAELYQDSKEYFKAYQYYDKAYKIVNNIFGSFHPLMGTICISLGNFHSKQGEHLPSPINREEYYGKALTYYQKAIQSLFRGFTDSTIYVNPVIPESFKSKKEREAFRKKINSMPVLLDALVGKAEAFYNIWKIKK
ncbi:MAG: tetratricopeptide repeat protein [Cytophagales bacterium]|nr:tetratricopeptide repeat protein [Cytophagales bacterium]